MSKIKFGTDGWRAIIAREFTTENVARVSDAVSRWLDKNYITNKKVIVGYDCRFGGKMFAEVASEVFLKNGITVIFGNKFSTTPMVSMATKKYGAALGIVITASHNPPNYNGYKLKADFGGPLDSDKIQEIEDMIQDNYNGNLFESDIYSNNNFQLIDLETMYINEVKSSFDLDIIRNSGLKFSYNAMYGAGQNIFRRILTEQVELYNCEYNPSFHDIAPEPIMKNIIPFTNYVKENGKYACGLITDGDADRIGLVDNEGNFIDSHHIMLLILNFLVNEKKYLGKVVIAATATPKIGKLAEYYNLDFEVVKVGFKYIASKMVTEDVIMGGEESGGIAIKGQMPERDGIWIGLTIWEYMAKSGKTIKDLISDIYNIVGEFQYHREDLHLTNMQKENAMNICIKNNFDKIGNYKIKSIDTTDGFKYIFENDNWVMIRASGTEPVLRVYAEGKTIDEAKLIINKTQEFLNI